MTKILYVCTMNKWRSRTAEAIFKNSQNVTVRSAGTSNRARVKLNAQLLNWADKIYVMEDKHKDLILNKFRNETKFVDITVLHIEDKYKYMDEELIEILKAEMNFV